MNVLSRQRRSRGHRDGNAFVSGAKQHIKFQAGIDNGLCVSPTQLSKSSTVADCTQVKEVRADPTRVQRKLAELQNILSYQEINKSSLFHWVP